VCRGACWAVFLVLLQLSKSSIISLGVRLSLVQVTISYPELFFLKLKMFDIEQPNTPNQFRKIIGFLVYIQLPANL